MLTLGTNIVNLSSQSFVNTIEVKDQSTIYNLFKLFIPQASPTHIRAHEITNTHTHI